VWLIDRWIDGTRAEEGSASPLPEADRINLTFLAQSPQTRSILSSFLFSFTVTQQIVNSQYFLESLARLQTALIPYRRVHHPSHSNDIISPSSPVSACLSAGRVDELHQRITSTPAQRSGAMAQGRKEKSINVDGSDDEDSVPLPVQSGLTDEEAADWNRRAPHCESEVQGGQASNEGPEGDEVGRRRQLDFSAKWVTSTVCNLLPESTIC
jgi:hypothetical protein